MTVLDVVVVESCCVGNNVVVVQVSLVVLLCVVFGVLLSFNMSLFVLLTKSFMPSLLSTSSLFGILFSLSSESEGSCSFTMTSVVSPSAPMMKRMHFFFLLKLRRNCSVLINNIWWGRGAGGCSCQYA